jgi:hypothetical protein
MATFSDGRAVRASLHSPADCESEAVTPTRLPDLQNSHSSTIETLFSWCVSTPQRPTIHGSLRPARTASLSFLLRSQTGHHIPVVAFATMLLTPVPSFDRSDATLSRVGDASGLTRRGVCRILPLDHPTRELAVSTRCCRSRAAAFWNQNTCDSGCYRIGTSFLCTRRCCGTWLFEIFSARGF